MPVRFKGLSEYQRNFLWKKSYLSESYNPSVGRKYSWAGLRSDQLGITKEPSFISKRRVPYHDPQISKSLEWNGAITENDMVVPPEPQTLQTPKPQETEQKEDANQERTLSLEASRVPKRTRSHSADSRVEGASDAAEKHQDVTRNHAPDHEEVGLEASSKPLAESVDPRVGLIISILLHPVLRFFLVTAFLSGISGLDASRLLEVTNNGSILNTLYLVLVVLRRACPGRTVLLWILFSRDLAPEA
ncbi:Mdm1 [Phodopus roborovskii]|uniref:Nuclear protein MDM1 n=1 Tax=Phodopus roborovskii TaxID=109678 RepID=A0AAU9YUA2_PHORO|nr:Mdm1 [Phodopus roborovskii]